MTEVWGESMSMRIMGKVSVGTERMAVFFFFSSRRRHTRFDCDWSSDVCSSDLIRHHRANWRRGINVECGNAQIRSGGVRWARAEHLKANSQPCQAEEKSQHG